MIQSFQEFTNEDPINEESLVGFMDLYLDTPETDTAFDGEDYETYSFRDDLLKKYCSNLKAKKLVEIALVAHIGEDVDEAPLLDMFTQTKEFKSVSLSFLDYETADKILQGTIDGKQVVLMYGEEYSQAYMLSHKKDANKLFKYIGANRY